MRWHGWLLAGALLAGCAGSLPQPTAVDADRAGTSLAQLSRGRDLYVTKCSGCHAPLSPASRAAAAWPEPVDEMAERAHIDATEREAILLYLTTYARR